MWDMNEIIKIKYRNNQQCPVRFLRKLHLLSQTCHSRILLAG
ncbi:MAG: hypothetical protein SCABRO_03184, partial [Candidatus Scalindua brodae]